MIPKYKVFKVSGKSMEADSIYQGDMVVVQENAKIVNKDIIVLSLPDKTLLVKHFIKKGKHLGFYPFNIADPTPSTPRIMDNAVILGKVVAVLCQHKNKHLKKEVGVNAIR